MMSWEDSNSLEYVSRKSRKINDVEEFVEIRRIVENDEVKEIKLIIGNQKGKIGLNLSINDWKSLLIFLNTIKTKNFSSPKAIPIIPQEKVFQIKSESKIKELSIEEKSPILIEPIIDQKEPEPIAMKLPKEEKLPVIPEIIVHRKEPEPIAMKLPKEEKLPVIPEIIVHRKEPESIAIKLPKEEESPIIPEIIVHREEPVSKKEKLPPSPPIKSNEKEINEIKVIQEQLDSQFKTAEKEAENIISVLESSIEPDLQKSVNAKLESKTTELGSKPIGDLSKSMEILGFHEKEEFFKQKEKDLKIDLPILKPMPKATIKHASNQKLQDSITEIDLTQVQDIEKLFPELKEEKKAVPRVVQKVPQIDTELDDKVADLVLKDQDLKEFSDEIIKKALALQEELGLNKEEKEKKIRTAVEDVTSFMPSGPAKDFVSSMLQKKPSSSEPNMIIKLNEQRDEPQLEIVDLDESMENIDDKPDLSDKKPVELKINDFPEEEEFANLEGLRKIEPIRAVDQGNSDDDIPTIWELMEEKEKLDEMNQIELSQNANPINLKRKKLRFW